MAPITPRRIAHAILRCYPPAWRRRYASEVWRLVNDVPIRWRQVADLGSAAISEWTRPRNWGSPLTGLGIEATGTTLLLIAAGFVCVAAGRALGIVLSTWGWSTAGPLSVAAFAIESLFFLRVVIAIMATSRTYPPLWKRPMPWLALGWAELAVWTSCFVVAIAFEQLSAVAGGPDRFFWYRPTPLFLCYLATRRGVRVSATLAKLRKRARLLRLKKSIGSVFHLDESAGTGATS